MLHTRISLTLDNSRPFKDPQSLSHDNSSFVNHPVSNSVIRPPADNATNVDHPPGFPRGDWSPRSRVGTSISSTGLSDRTLTSSSLTSSGDLEDGRSAESDTHEDDENLNEHVIEAGYTGD